MTPDYASAPNGFGESWRLYYENGISPGSFGASLLCGDLVGAVQRADRVNIDLIPKHVWWLWDNLPYNAWGSPEVYQQWTAKGGLNGRNGKANDN